LIKLILFDIDGTLLDAGDLSSRSFLHAIRECVGPRAAIGSYSLSGKTDPQIMKELLLQNGVPLDRIDRVAEKGLESYQSYYLAHLGGTHVQALEGASELVERLSGVPWLTLGILSGNSQAIIAPKLEAAGMSVSSFAVVVCGSDDADRGNLPALARREAERLRESAISAQEVAIVGDTPLDIACARGFGAVSIAVSTGEYTRAQLLAAGPRYLIRSLSEWSGVEKSLIEGLATGQRRRHSVR
jgi:phosphoglycolate phosphatase